MDDAYLLYAVPVAALAGALLACLAACLPGLRAAALLALCGWGWRVAGASDRGGGAFMALGCAAGVIIGHGVASVISAVILGAPDEGSIFQARAGRRRMAAGRGREAVVLSVLGAAGGMVLFLACVAPLLAGFLPMAMRAIAPHRHWLLWCVIVFILMSVRPRVIPGALSPPRALRRGWAPAIASLAAFALSGVLGLVVMNPSGAGSSRDSVAAFAGLFALPCLILRVLRGDAPDPSTPPSRKAPAAPRGRAADSGTAWAWGVPAGALGGLAAALISPLSGGLAGLFAENMPCERDDRSTLVVQGAARLVCSAMWALSLFVPGAGAAQAAGWVEPRDLLQGASPHAYAAGVMALLAAGAGACLLTPLLSALILPVTARYTTRSLTMVLMGVTLAVVLGTDGPAGLPVLLVATCIGLLPLLFESRGFYCLGIVLLPQVIAASGLAPACARVFGLN